MDLYYSIMEAEKLICVTGWAVWTGKPDFFKVCPGWDRTWYLFVFSFTTYL